MEYWDNKKAFNHSYSEYLIPNAIHLFYTDYLTLSFNRIAKTTLAVDLYKLQYEKLPENLHTLVNVGILDKIPVNPYTNKSVKYEIINDDFRIYMDGLAKCRNTWLSGTDNIIDNDKLYWILPEGSLQTQKEADND